MLLATATKRFDDIKGIDKALFEAFKIHELKQLNTEECRLLLSSVTGDTLDPNRVRPIEILTGGNPRLLAMLSSFRVHKSFRELIKELTFLVDDHTAFFKSQIDGLAPTERKAFLALAEIWDPATARQVSDYARMNVNMASSLLKRLVSRSAVVELPLESRKIAYQVAERLYNVYYLMRRRGGPANRVHLAVQFMIRFYEPKELVDAAKYIAEEACCLNDPRVRSDHYCAFGIIWDNIQQSELREQFLKNIPPDFFKLSDLPPQINEISVYKAKSEAQVVGRRDSHDEIESQDASFRKLHKGISKDELERINELMSRVGDLLEKQKQPEEAVRILKESIKDTPESLQYVQWGAIGFIYHENLSLFEQAEEAYRRAIKIKNNHAMTWGQLGQLLHMHLNRYDEAEKAYRKAIEIHSDITWPWLHLGLLLQDHLNQYEKAEEAYRKITEIEPSVSFGWELLGQLLHEHLNRYDEAEEAYRKAMDIDPDSSWAAVKLSTLILRSPERSKEALEYLRIYLKDKTVVEQSMKDAIKLIMELAARGHGHDVLETLQASPSSELMEPILVGLRLDLGEEPLVAKEIMEVGKDVRKRIEKQRRELKK